jgi:hypothetical protein
MLHFTICKIEKNLVVRFFRKFHSLGHVRVIGFKNKILHITMGNNELKSELETIP